MSKRSSSYYRHQAASSTCTRPLRLAGSTCTCRFVTRYLSQSQIPNPKSQSLPRFKRKRTTSHSKPQQTLLLFNSISFPFPETQLISMEDPASYRLMARNFSSASNDSSSAFSDCNSDRSGDFALTSQLAHRLLLSSASDSYYSDELVRALISDLESDSVEAQRLAATELRLMAKHSPENRVRIAQAGAVRPLVGLISSNNPQIQEQGVTAILNLSICDENKGGIVSAGAIKPLVRALRTGTVTARENAACALLRLAQVEDHRIAIGRSGAIPPLVSLLETGGFRGKKDAATALYALCCSARENKIKAVEAGIVRPLLEMMADPESGMVDKAAFVLQTVVDGVAEAKVAAVNEGGVPVLVEIVEVGTQRQKEIAADVLLQICQESVLYRGMVAREGAIPPLVALTQTGTSRAKKKAEALVGLLRQPRTAKERVETDVSL